MLRLRVLIFASALVAVAAWAGPAPAVPKARSACQRLQAKHEDLSPHRKLVLVSRGSFETGSIAACVLPRGRVRRLARWDDGLGRAGADVVATKGFFVLVGESWGDQYGGVSQSLERVDARTGRRVGLAAYACMTDFGSASPCPSGTAYGDVVLAARGAGAIELTDLGTRTTTLEAFGASGTLSRLDDGPVDSLRIEGGEIVWVRAGVERRAPLPA